MKKQAFLIATHLLTDNIIKLYFDIKQATEKYGEAFLLYHQKDKNIKDKWPEIKKSIFSDNILHKLGYLPLWESLVPGNNHFPLLQFFLTNSAFDFYWYIEHDIHFNGDWKYLIKTFNRINDDFISSYIEQYEDNPDWPWWETLYHPVKSIAIDKRIRSFNPVYRISNLALHFLDKQMNSGWAGHHEVLIPTLLYHNDFKISDFGGDGKFVRPDFKNKFYTSDTMRWRPIFTQPGKQKNMLYHPVKY